MRGLVRVTAAVAMMSMALVACGSGSDSADETPANQAPSPAAGTSAGAGSGSTSNTGTEIRIPYLADLTGSAAFCGQAVQGAADIAAKYVNESGMLEGRTLAFDYHDSASDGREAASTMSAIAASSAIGVLNGCHSGVAQAIAPVAQSAGLPMIAMQSGSKGILEAGDQIFRATAPQTTMTGVQAEYYAGKGVQNVAVMYQADNPTLTDMADAYASSLPEAGLTVTITETFQGADFDFAPLASKVVDTSPDLVLMLCQGTPCVTIATQLLQSGYEGYIGGAQMGNNVLAPLGEQGNGITWVSDFNEKSTQESVTTFIQYYTDNGGNPDQIGYAAQTWDQVLLLAEGLSRAETVDREGLHAGLLAAAAEGFDGACGSLTFENQDARVSGTMVEWRDDRIQVIE